MLRTTIARMSFTGVAGDLLLQIPLSVPTQAPGIEAIPFYTQPLQASTTLEPVLGAPSQLTVLDASS